VPGVLAHGALPAGTGPFKKTKAIEAMTHRYAAGDTVYDEPAFGNAAARGNTIVRPLPVENDDRRACRIKSLAESFERIAEGHQLSRGA